MIIIKRCSMSYIVAKYYPYENNYLNNNYCYLATISQNDGLLPMMAPSVISSAYCVVTQVFRNL